MSSGESTSAAAWPGEAAKPSVAQPSGVRAGCRSAGGRPTRRSLPADVDADPDQPDAARLLPGDDGRLEDDEVARAVERDEGVRPAGDEAAVDDEPLDARAAEAVPRDDDARRLDAAAEQRHVVQLDAGRCRARRADVRDGAVRREREAPRTALRGDPALGVEHLDKRRSARRGRAREQEGRCSRSDQAPQHGS